MKNRKIDILLIGIILILTFSCFQCVIPTNGVQEGIEDNNVMLSSPGPDLPEFEWKSVWPTPNYDYGLALELDSSENVHIAGYTGSYPDYDILYVSYDKDGNYRNAKMTNLNPGYDIARDITLDSSDNIFISGYTDVDDSSATNYNIYVTKMSSLGFTQWERFWGGTEYDVARTVALDSSENVYIGGLTWSYSAGLADALIIKYSNAGAFQWYKTYGGTDSEWVNKMVIDSADNFYLGGGFKLDGGTYNDIHLIKVDSNGNKQWDRTWGGAGDDIGVSVALDSVGCVYILGYTESYGAVNRDVCLIKYNSLGDLMWNLTWGTDEYEDPGAITIDKFDDIYLGASFSNLTASKDYAVLVKFDSNGNQIWNMTYEASVSTEYLTDLTLADSGDIYTVGYEYVSGAGSDLNAMKFNYNLPDILLKKPENKTYTEPMNGYYMATYGFENDPNGDYPSEWVPESNGGTCQVIQSLGEHKKVLELYDSNVPDGHIGITNPFSSTQTDGTVEFYFRTSDANKETDILLYENAKNEGVRLVIKLNNMWYYKSMTYVGLGTPIQNNRWYHIRIEFNSTTGIFWLWVDGVRITRYGGNYPYQNNNAGMNYLSLTSWHYDGIYYSYFDAIGYSWESSYDIGDNLIEGLLIDYKMPSNIEWQAYSLDGQENKTTIGSTVIPFLEDGKHTIQIFGNNTDGDLFKSEKRYFTVDTKLPQIFINSPDENLIFEGVPPEYDITIIEENVVSTWYTLDGGITNITVTELSDFIDFETWHGTPDGPVQLEFYVKDILGNIAYDTITITKEVTNPILVELVDLMCTEESFNFTFNIHNDHGIGLNSANIVIWWNGTDVSTSIQNLGDGIYFISLEPILVAPGEDPILLTMTVSELGYDETYFETTVSIDPDTVLKDQDGTPNLEFPFEIIIIISTVSGGALIGIITYIYIKRRKRT